MQGVQQGPRPHRGEGSHLDSGTAQLNTQTLSPEDSHPTHAPLEVLYPTHAPSEVLYPTHAPPADPYTHAPSAAH